MSTEEENMKLRQIIKVMEDNEKRMHSKMEEMLRKQERERGKWRVVERALRGREKKIERRVGERDGDS